MSVYSYVGCLVKDLAWKVYSNGTKSNEIIVATRIEDNKRKEYYIGDLRADGGIKEINDALQA